MINLKKSYYAIIPANVRYDKDLRANSKLLYGEITALCNDKGYCWANNKYFSELYEVSKETISRWVSELTEKGYVKVDLIYKEGTNQIINRYIRISQEPIDEIVNTPIDEIVKDNNTSTNNTVNTTSNKTIVEKLDNMHQEIIEYLNLKTNKQFRATTKKTQTLIKARMNEGFTVDDFKKVIDKKSVEWNNDKEMNKFLRPETLFGTKFEGYLNQEVKRNIVDIGYNPEVDSF